MSADVLHLDSSHDCGSPIFDSVARAQSRRRRFELALLPIAALASVVVVVVTLWLGAR